jgi:hypothetical protein
MIVSIIPTEIHGRWARLVRVNEPFQIFYQMHKEDIVQLYHYTPRGITITDSSMRYRGTTVTTSCVIEVHEKHFEFRRETPEEFLERTEKCSDNDEVSTSDSLISHTSVQID